MSSSFWNNKQCRYSYSNIRTSISFLNEDVLSFSKLQAVLLFIFEYTSFNLFPNWSCPPLFETTIGVAICIRIYVKCVWISADGVVERRDQTDDPRFIFEPFCTKTVWGCHGCHDGDGRNRQELGRQRGEKQWQYRQRKAIARCEVYVAVSLFVFEYTLKVSGFQLMVSWNDETKRTIRGLFTNHFSPKRYRGVTDVTKVMA